MPGQSGATVVVEGDVAVKRGTSPSSSAACVAQGLWLMRYESVHLPTVHSVLEDGYVMEQLTHLPVGLVNWESLTRQVVMILHDDLWGDDDLADKPDWDAHERYVAQLTERFGFSARLMPWMRELRELDLIQANTHGDPTFSNTMLRNGGGGYFYDVVLCDPIPARPELPQLAALDVGKILQSVYGYEMTRFGWPYGFVRECEEAAFDLLCPEDVEASQYFAFFHMLRAMKYCANNHRNGLATAMKFHLDRLGR